MSVHPEPPPKQAWDAAQSSSPSPTEDTLAAEEPSQSAAKDTQADEQQDTLAAEEPSQSAAKDTQADEQQLGCLDKSVQNLEQWWTTDGFTGHGIPRIFEGNMGQRAFWFVSVCVFLGFICHGTITPISEYLDRPFTTTTAINVTDEIPFPAVTICPSHHFRPTYNPIIDLKNGGFRDKLCNASLYILDFGFGDAMSSEFRNLVGDKNQSWSVTNAKKIAEHWQTHIIAASSSFSFGGACATFNGNGQYVAKFSSEVLDVSLSVMTTCNKSVSGLPPEDQGFIVLLHDPSERGSEMSLKSRGIIVGPGERTAIRYNPKRYTRTSEPIGSKGVTCRGGSYRRDACLEEKKWKAERDLCGCASPPPLEQPELSCYARADALAAQSCLQTKGAEIQSRTFEDCPDSCNKLDFVSSSSHCTYPSEHHADHLWQYMMTTPLGQEANLSIYGTQGPQSKMLKMQMLQQLAVKVVIGPSDISTEEVSIDLKYADVSALLSSIGGAWGFWLGFSIVTFAELLLTPFVVADRVIRGKEKDL